MPRVLWRVSLWGKSVHLRRCGVVCSLRAVSLWWTACCSPTARYSKWLFAMYTTNKPRNLYFQAFITPIISCVAKSRSSSGVRSWIASDFFFFFLADIQTTSFLCQVQSVYLNGTGNVALCHLFEMFFSAVFPAAVISSFMLWCPGPC